MFRYNPPSPFDPTSVDWLGEPPDATLDVRIDDARSILSHNDGPDLPFNWSVNPYRGCFHGCTYCYARPTHNWWDLGAGTDFERVLLVKPRAAELLAAAFERRSWPGELVFFSGNTDCYQPLERTWGLTRACLEVCLDYRNPVSVLTKSALVARDADLLADLARKAHAHVTVSIGIWDVRHAKAVEPWAPPPKLRLRAVEALARAGVPVGVFIGPVIPGLSERDIPKILRAARDAGARWTGKALLRLPEPVDLIFEDSLFRALPLKAAGVLARLHRIRKGRVADWSMDGEVGPEWQLIDDVFHLYRDRLGFEDAPRPPEVSPFSRPSERRQLGLFG